MGARPAALVRVFRRHGWPDRGHAATAALIVLSSLVQWPGCVWEDLRRAMSRDGAAPVLAPVFIVGHWRSGTTLLQSFLSRDPALVSPNLSQVLLPHQLLPGLLSRWKLRLLGAILPEIRPMDGVPVGPLEPAEEEIALAAMAAPSFFNGLYFPRNLERVLQSEVLGFADAEASMAWRNGHLEFCRRMSAIGGGRRLLLKSPGNSARVALLDAMYPGARFIHIHREPSDVIASTRALYRALLPLFALQAYDLGTVDRAVAGTYCRLMTQLLDDLAALPADRVASIGFADLLARPLDTMRGVYRALDLGPQDRAETAVGRALSVTPLTAPGFLGTVAVPEPAVEAVARRLGYR
jgi:hypothetical protein